jgi:hypothetical protein
MQFNLEDLCEQISSDKRNSLEKPFEKKEVEDIVIFLPNDNLQDLMVLIMSSLRVVGLSLVMIYSLWLLTSTKERWIWKVSILLSSHLLPRMILL